MFNGCLVDVAVDLDTLKKHLDGSMDGAYRPKKGLK